MGVSLSAEAKQYKSAEIFTTDAELYGKYVFRMKAAKGSGVISNFFLWKDGSELSDVFWEEVDIEVFGKNGATSWQSNLITGLGSRVTSEQVHDAGYSFGDDYHTFAIEWSPGQVRWLVDGQLIRQTNSGQANDLNSPAQARFNFWPPDVESWVGSLNDAILPVHMFVNWMEYHAWNGQGFELAWRDDFDTFNTSRWGKADWTFDENQADFSPDNAVTRNGYLVLSMTREGQEGYSGTPPVDFGSVTSSSVSSISSISSSRSSAVSSVRSSVRSSVSSSVSSSTAVGGNCQYKVNNAWGNGFTGSITITNNGSSAINGWNVSWNYNNNAITSSWNARVSGSYTASDMGWNGTIQPGNSVEFGFQGTTNGGQAETPVVTGSVCSGNVVVPASSIAASSTAAVQSSSAVVQRSSTAVQSSSAVSSSPQQCEELCQWYQDAPRPLCVNQSSGWGWENNNTCIGRTTCESQFGNGGVISNCDSPASSIPASSAPASSVPASSIPANSSSSSSPSTDGQFRVDTSGNITKDGSVLPVRCASWFGLEGQHEPKDAENNPDGAPMELYVGNMWWSNGGQGTGRTIQQTMDEITAAGFNVVRFPIVPQTLDANDPQGIGFAQNGGVLKNHESVRQENARQAMEDFIKLADQNDIDLIIDIHSCSNYLGWRAGRLDSKPPYADADRINYDYTREGYSCSATGNPSSVIQVDAYGESQWLEDLREIASLSEQLGVDNIMAIDIFNEPWDYTWAEWKALSEKAYQAIAAENDDILIMVEGIAGGTSDDVEVPHGSAETNPNWGENFYPARDDMLDIPKERLIISPHTYGPSVFVQQQFLDQNQAGCAGLEGDEAADAGCNIVINPAVLEAGWEEHFGFLRDQGYAMVIGEFGGMIDWPQGADNGVNWPHVTDNVDEQWQNAFVDYMIDNDIQGCYWSINPESADTGGLYQHAHVKGSNESGWGEWLDFDTRKLNLLKRLWGI